MSGARPLFSHVHAAVEAGPISCSGVRLFSFVVPVSRSALARLVARELEAPTDGALRVRPAGQAVLVVHADLPTITSARGGVGSVAEREAAIWVPIERTLEDGSVESAWWVPYMIVDEPTSLVAGRELFGFSKELGRFAFDPTSPFDGADLRSARVAAHAVPERGGRSALHDLWSVEASLDGEPARVGWEAMLLANGASASDLLRRVATGKVRFLALRQLRDIEEPDRAAFKEVVAFEARVRGRPRVSRLDRRFTFRASDLATHPLSRALGLDGPVDALAAAHVALDFELGEGRSVWRAGVGPTPSPAPAVPRRRERVAVLGGGIAGLTAALELTRTPEGARRFDVTVYESSFRLGGHAASGRDPARAHRSVEHGLHIWFGFYVNAFQLLSDVYDELARSPHAPLATFAQAFAPQSLVAFHGSWGGCWHRWIGYSPVDGALPASGRTWATRATALPDARSLVRRLLEIARGWIEGRPFLAHEDPGAPSVDADSATFASAPPPANLEDTSPAAALRIRTWWRARTERWADDEARRPFRVVVDFVLLLAAGIARDGLVTRGFEAVDDEDFRAWLRRHGAGEDVLGAPPLTALYDAAFAYADGDLSRPSLSASAAIVVVLRMVFTYEGALIWKMTAGMGETVIAPMYEVLRRRGVRFRFFHRVERLELSADGSEVTRVVGARDAEPWDEDHDPLILVGDLPCWPVSPRSELYKPAREAPPPFTLDAARDFDRVVLALPAPTAPDVVRELTARDGRWSDAVALATVRTLSVQLWLRPTLGALGWRRGEAIWSGLPHALGSWLDSSPVLDHERWPEGARPGALLVSSGAIGDRDLDARELQREVAELLHRHSSLLAPRGIRPDDLVDLDERTGDDRIAAQVIRLNSAPADRYVQCVPGSARRRLAPDGSGVRNLTLAGTWTRTGLDIASIESAVMSGQLAASAIDGEERLVVGAAGSRR